MQFSYGLNYLIDIDNAVIADVELTPARTYDEVAARRLGAPLMSELLVRGSPSAVPLGRASIGGRLGWNFWRLLRRL